MGKFAIVLEWCFSVKDTVSSHSRNRKKYEVCQKINKKTKFQGVNFKRIYIYSVGQFTHSS